VQGEQRRRPVAVQQARVDHRPRAVERFLSGLEDEHHAAVQGVAEAGQQLGGAEGHCHVGIVATGVRDAQGQGGVGPVGDFLNGQRIHVGAIGQGGTRMGTLEDAHHTVPAHVLLDLQAELAQP